MIGILHKEKTSDSMSESLNKFQEKLDLMFSHINSVPSENLGGKTPLNITKKHLHNLILKYQVK